MSRITVDELLQRYDRADLSVAYELCDRHPADAPAFTIVESDLSDETLTYGELRDRSERLAAALAEMGIGPGDRVATLMGKSADLLVTLLAIWRRGAVDVPLFTAFAPPAIAMRLRESRATVVICDASQRSKLDPGDDIPNDAPWRIVVAGADGNDRSGDAVLRELIEGQSPGITAVAVGRDAPMIHMFTSGTTGTPKGVAIPTFAIASIHAYMDFGLDVQPDDVFWCAADPGWAYGLYYAITGPLACGRHALLLSAGFSPELTWSVLERYGVTNLAAAPTVFRSLRAASADLSDLTLRCVSSAGEPLTPDVNEWAVGALGTQVHDHYGQTETGMTVNNHHRPDLAQPIKAASMGRAMPGWSPHVLAADSEDDAGIGVVGRLAIDMRASPLAWFHGYHEAPDATASKFSEDGRWYFTGDVASIDDDGNFHFASRDDDIIIMAGYRIGPFEVESVLSGHPAVLESAAVAAPDEIRGEVLEAYVVLNDGVVGSPELAVELQQLVKTQLAAHAFPRTIHFVDGLPKTPSGKVQRFILRQQLRASRS